MGYMHTCLDSSDFTNELINGKPMNLLFPQAVKHLITHLLVTNEVYQ